MRKLCKFRCKTSHLRFLYKAYDKFHFRCVSECSRGYYPEAGRCNRCVHGCAECASRLNCTSCSGSLRLQSGSCRVSCADGYFADRGTCSKCYLSCRTCSGPRRDQCASCPTGWKLAAGECHPECPQGTYISIFFLEIFLYLSSIDEEN